MGYRLGVDVGGTFTDLLLIDEATGRTFRDKVPSTPSDPSQAVINGARGLCERQNIAPADIDLFLHGTTVATNAVLEKKIAKVGLVVTDGYRHLMQIARSLVPGGLAAWIIWPKPEPMAALERTIEAPERMDAEGKTVRELDEAEMRARLERLKASEEIEALTICLMNSYVDGRHEKAVAAICAEVFPDIPISISSDILPEMQEYERALTTIANSAVRPAVARYVGNLERELKDWGSKAKLNLLRSDGGLMSAEKSAEAPVNLLMSGPAGGVAGAVWVAKSAGVKNILTLDMGGTSTDVALIENGAARLQRETSVGDLNVRASSIDVKTVGAGGGSIAFVPELTKALRVGPESAGAVPGPVAYGKGGELPTVTDANVVLGYLPESLLGGSFTLDREGAKKSVQTISDALGIDLMDAAAGIIDIVNENMFGALRLVSVQQGYDPRDFALMGFGGAGPLHANAMGKLMNSWPVIIPPSPGVLCAYGDATTRQRVETQRSFNKMVQNTSDEELTAYLDSLGAQVKQELEAEDVAPGDIELLYEIDIRYAGQAFEIPLSVEPAGLSIASLITRFDTEHERLFTFNLDETPHEIVNVRAVALGKSADVAPPVIEKGDADPSAAKTRDHQLYMDGKMQDAVIYDRALLKAGNSISGPAIVTEMDSTTLVHSGCEALVDDHGNLIINLVEGA
ncbi:hydantoinase/oxoprolinase family protein [Parasphingorhabdus flavimaris]|uniref:Hydantoinase/oxoprolinase family protein n=1 Tax=Parasphingorhabdus flavimaris TaxID=266812 RepID=A0ABX2N5K8_9SPHN|nr:hydantoinase/oxoprolinase family protein [Parasphingorhabdus flavimaris]NVD28969.1 hydantoinase/oxoprolinase family protein [Parasphingorhabdus flavimaris]|tara:strand:+ start:9702 stop:11756 length:2055 start_codon:yes stop_codon:yes gene_type:complete